MLVIVRSALVIRVHVLVLRATVELTLAVPMVASGVRVLMLMLVGVLVGVGVLVLMLVVELPVVVPVRMPVTVLVVVGMLVLVAVAGSLRGRVVHGTFRSGERDRSRR